MTKLAQSRSRAALLRVFLPPAVILTLLCGIIYLSAQQVLRQSANDIPQQMADDAAFDLSTGRLPEALKADAKVDMAESLSPYLMYFDEQCHVVASSAQLDGKTPVPPAGVFEAARANGKNRLTWRPRRGVRGAICVVHFAGAKSGFVVAGHSLSETQAHIQKIGQLIFAGWFASQVILFGILTALLLFSSSVAPVVSTG